jgi:hypothetical protein
MRRDLISKVMREMGRKGGKAAKGKGVKARMAALTPEQRKELAKKAAQTRWAKAKKKPKSPKVRGIAESGFLN